jgi:hypothetical protein
VQGTPECPECYLDSECNGASCELCPDLTFSCTPLWCNAGTCESQLACAPPAPCAVLPLDTGGDPGCPPVSSGWAWDGAGCHEVIGCQLTPNHAYLDPDEQACLSAHAGCM